MLILIQQHHYWHHLLIIYLQHVYIQPPEDRRHSARQKALLQCVWQKNQVRNTKVTQVKQDCTRRREQGTGSEDEVQVAMATTSLSAHNTHNFRRKDKEAVRNGWGLIAICSATNINLKYQKFCIKKIQKLNITPSVSSLIYAHTATGEACQEKYLSVKQATPLQCIHQYWKHSKC